MQSSGIDNIQIRPNVYDEFIAILKSTLLVNGCDLSNFYYDNLESDSNIKAVFLFAVEQLLHDCNYDTAPKKRRDPYSKNLYDKTQAERANGDVLFAPPRKKCLSPLNTKRKWSALFCRGGKVGNDDGEVDITGRASFKTVKSRKKQDEKKGDCSAKKNEITQSINEQEKLTKDKEKHLSSLLGEDKFKELINQICIKLRSSSQQSLVGGKSTSCT